MDEFERLLEAERISVERFVKFRISAKADAEDVLQEVFFSAYQKYAQLKNTIIFERRRPVMKYPLTSWRNSSCQRAGTVFRWFLR